MQNVDRYAEAERNWWFFENLRRKGRKVGDKNMPDREKKLRNWSFRAFIDYEVDEETGDGEEPDQPDNYGEIMMAIEDLLNKKWPRSEGPWGCQFEGTEIK